MGRICQCWAFLHSSLKSACNCRVHCVSWKPTFLPFLQFYCYPKQHLSHSMHLALKNIANSPSLPGNAESCSSPLCCLLSEWAWQGPFKQMRREMLPRNAHVLGQHLHPAPVAQSTSRRKKGSGAGQQGYVAPKGQSRGNRQEGGIEAKLSLAG